MSTWQVGESPIHVCELYNVEKLRDRSVLKNEGTLSSTVLATTFRDGDDPERRLLLLLEKQYSVYLAVDAEAFDAHKFSTALWSGYIHAQEKGGGMLQSIISLRAALPEGYPSLNPAHIELLRLLEARHESLTQTKHLTLPESLLTLSELAPAPDSLIQSFLPDHLYGILHLQTPSYAFARFIVQKVARQGEKYPIKDILSYVCLPSTFDGPERTFYRYNDQCLPDYYCRAQLPQLEGQVCVPQFRGDQTTLVSQRTAAIQTHLILSFDTLSLSNGKKNAELDTLNALIAAGMTKRQADLFIARVPKAMNQRAHLPHADLWPGWVLECPYRWGIVTGFVPTLRRDVIKRVVLASKPIKPIKRVLEETQTIEEEPAVPKAQIYRPTKLRRVDGVSHEKIYSDQPLEELFKKAAARPKPPPKPIVIAPAPKSGPGTLFDFFGTKMPN